MKLFRSILLGISCIVLNAAAMGQRSGPDSVNYTPVAERNFQEGMKNFTERHYLPALERFQSILNLSEKTHRTSASYLMGAKSLYHLGEYQSSASLLHEFQNRFSHSEYLDDAAYTLGLDLFQLEQYQGSARAFLAACESSSDSLLTERAEKMLGIVATTNLELPDLRELLRESKLADAKALLSLKLAEKILRTGDAKEARELIRTSLALRGTGPFAKEAQDMLARLERGGVLKIGVVLPLSFKSDQSSAPGLGQEMLDGIHVAIDEYNAEAIPKVNLEVRDSERDAGVAARQVSELSSNEDILAIVGPMFSNEVFSSAGLASKRGVPLLTPTATSVGIAAIGESVFQANPDFVVRGRAMAQYAILELGAQRLAVLASSDTVNTQIVNAFVREVNDLGGQIVDVERYKPGQTDLRDALAPMRRKGMEISEPVVLNFGGKVKPVDIKRMAAWGVPQTVLDSLSASGSIAEVTSLFGERGVRIADSLKLATQRVRAKYDSLPYPVSGIDALFASIGSSDEIGIVAPQLRYFNFQTQLLGTGNWQDAVELDQNRQYANGVIFAADAYWEDIDQQYQNFARQYKAKYSRDPQVNAMIGYDAMRLLLRTIRQGATRREDVIAALRSNPPFQGVHAKINFDQRRVNACLTIMQFKGRAIKKIGDIDVARKLITGN